MPRAVTRHNDLTEKELQVLLYFMEPFWQSDWRIRRWPQQLVDKLRPALTECAVDFERLASTPKSVTDDASATFCTAREKFAASFDAMRGCLREHLEIIKGTCDATKINPFTLVIDEKNRDEKLYGIAGKMMKAGIKL